MTEIELCEHIIRYHEGYEVFKEVYLNGRCDIVVRKGPIIVAIEAKLQFSTNLIYQALRHFPYCNYAYVAVVDKGKADHYAGQRLCEKLGIGVLTVKVRPSGGTYVEERDFAAYRRRIVDPVLFEYQKLSIAGAQHNNMSQFKQSIRGLERILDKGPVSMKDLFGKNLFHWSNSRSAQQCICKYIRQGVLPQFGYEDGKLFLKENINKLL